MAQTHYTPFTVASGQVQNGPLSNFTAVINPTDSRFRTIANGGRVANANGYDIRPYSDAGLTTPLTYELAPGSYNASTGTFEMHVLLPSIDDDGSTVVYLGCGDSSLTTDGSSTSTWPSQYKGVWHLSNASSLDVNDSTSNANHGNASGVSAGSGKLAGGAHFPDTAGSERIHFGNPASLQITAAITLEGWLYWNTAVTNGPDVDTVISKNEGGGYGIIANLSGSGRLETWFYINGAYANAGETLSGNYSAGTWYYITATFDGTNTKFYRNGVLKQTVNRAGAISNVAYNLTLGANPDAGPAYTGAFGAGILDEWRVLNTAIGADEIVTKYNNQSAPNTFWTMGDQVPPDSTDSTGGAVYHYLQMMRA